MHNRKKEIFKQQSAFLKEEERAHRKQERRLKKRRSSFDDSLTAGTSKKSKIMSNIFNLPRMSCHFMQYGDADNPTQMLAARHLHAEYAFKIAKENKNVPTQDMMHTPCLLGECEKCCNGQYEHCRLPRTWCIGQCINFGAPYNPDGTPTKYVWQRKLSKDVWWVDPRYYKLAIISEMIKANEKQMTPFKKIQNKIDPRISLKTERIHSLMNAPH